MSITKTTSDHRPKNWQALQILRGVAATCVVYFHIQAVPQFGSFGVDIFFIISGFVMAMIVTNGQPAGTFIVNRLARIVPLYWLLTTALLLIAMIRPDLLNSTTADLSDYLHSLLFVPHFKDNGILSPTLAVGWTLNYEMFFYACVWLAMLISTRLRLVIATLMIALTFIYFRDGPVDSAAAVFYGNSVVFEFVLGIGVFAISRTDIMRHIGRRQSIALVIGSVAFMATTEALQTPGSRVVIWGIPAALLVLAAINLESLLLQFGGTTTRILARIGDASYATYLSHAYVVEALRKIAAERLQLFDPYTPLGVSVILLASISVGQLLYEFIDKPLSNKLKMKSAKTARVVVTRA